MGAQAQLKPRVVILTDIGQPDLEPDDTESLVHLLCYADQLAFLSLEKLSKIHPKTKSVGKKLSVLSKRRGKIQNKGVIASFYNSSQRMEYDSNINKNV
jgi:hypothetical protein